MGKELFASDSDMPYDQSMAELFNGTGGFGSPFDFNNSDFTPYYPVSATLARFNSFIIGMDKYFVPIICIIGAAGNLLAFVVFVASHLRRLSSSVYLAALSFADLGYLLVVLVEWAKLAGFDLYFRPGWCQFFAFLKQVLCFLSVWSIVSFTCERYILVCCPFQRRAMCTTRRAKVVVITLAILAGAMYCYVFFIFEVIREGPIKICGPSVRSAIVHDLLGTMDMFLTLLVPFLTILVLNAKIMYAVVYVYKKKQKELRQIVDQYHEADRSTRNQACTTTLNRYQVKVTKMLVIVSTTFLVLNFPIHVLRTHLFVQSVSIPQFQPSLAVLCTLKLFRYMFYINFAVNIFLYSAYGKNFKRATKQVYRRVKHNLSRCMTKHCCLRVCALYYRNGEPDWLTIRTTKDIRATFL